jgi:hypothetical protein
LRLDSSSKKLKKLKEMMKLVQMVKTHVIQSVILFKVNATIYAMNAMTKVAQSSAHKTVKIRVMLA